MAKFLLYFLLAIGTRQWVSAENPFEQENEDIASKGVPFIADHGTNLFERNDEYSLLDELTDLAASNNHGDTMATLDDDMTSGQADSDEKRRIEALINDQRFELAEMRDESNGQSCSTCFGNRVASCAKNSKVIKCASDQQCYTVRLTTKSTGENTIIKGCLETAKCFSSMCEKISNSSNGLYSYCDTKCCKENLCNQESPVAVTPRPLPLAPSAPSAPPKCRHCQGLDEATCEARTTVKQCDSGHRCAAVYVVQKTNGQGILAKGCMKNSICDSGLCKTLTKSGKYRFCKGSCCMGSLCSKDVDTMPTTKTPPTTAAPVSTEPPKPKCFACYGKSQQECDQKVIVKECDVGQTCYTAEATQKSNGKTFFTRDCSKLAPKDCASFCKKYEVVFSNCSYNCCEGILCNRPAGFSTSAPTTKPITHAPVTQRPVTGTVSPPMMCYHCNSQVSEEDCEAKRVLRQCSGNRICYIGRASYVTTGKTIIAKGCMRPNECSTTCKRLGEDIKDCSVFCCKKNSCNAMKMLPTTPTPHTVQPSQPTIGNPSLRALVKLIQAFKILLGAIETSVRVSATDFKASQYGSQIKSLMSQIDTHAIAAPIRKHPAAKEAKREMSQLRRRARDVLGKIENIRKKRNAV